jgi:hypothetical protein
MATRTISPAGGNWSDTTAWVEGAVPTNADDVVATATSGSLAITTGAVCQSFDLTGYTKTLSGAITLTIGGSAGGPSDIILKIPASGFTHSNTGNYALKTTAPTPQTVSVLLNLTSPIDISGSGTVRLAANLAMNIRDITHTAGTFDLNGFSVVAGSFRCTGAIARTLIFGTATVTLSDNATAFDVSGSNYTVSAASATFTMGNIAGFNGGGAVYGNVGWANISATASPALSGSSTFTNLTLASAGEFHFAAGTTQTVTGTLSIQGLATAQMNVATGPQGAGNSLTAGSVATIALGPAATVTLARVNFMDIAITGTGTPVAGTRLGDGGGNSGLVFNASRTLYWVGNAGNWNDSTNLHWALTSGGSPGASIPYPLPQDDVIIDGNSFSLPTQTITCTANSWLCRNFTASTTQTGCKTGSSSCSIFGSIAMSGQFSSNDTVLTCRSRVPTTLSPNIVLLSFRVQCPGTTFTLTGPMTCTSLAVLGGLFDAAGYDVTLGSFTATTTYSPKTPRELRMGGGLWTLRDMNADWTNDSTGNLFTFTPGTSTFRLTGNPTSVWDLADASQPKMPHLIFDLTPGKSVRATQGHFGDIVINSGTFELSTGTLGDCTSLTSSGTATRAISSSPGATFTVKGPITFAGSNLTTAGNVVLVCAPVSTALDTKVYANGVVLNQYRMLPPIGGQITLFAVSAVSALTCTGPVGGTGTVSLTESVVVGSMTAGGNSATNRLKVYGPPWGGTATITASATSGMSNVDLINIVQAGAATWTGTSKTNTFTGYTSQAIEV